MSSVDKARLGVITPLYVSPQQNLSSWIQLASIARRYPRVHVIGGVDVSHGPGLGPDSMMQANIPMLKENNVTVLAYVRVNNNTDSQAMMKDMKNWKNWYPDIDGFFFMEESPKDAIIDANVWLKLVDYAKGYLESKFVAAQIGLKKDIITKTNIDLYISYNNKNIPAPISSLKLYELGYKDDTFPYHKFGIIVKNVPTSAFGQSMALNFMQTAIARDVARYFYFHTDSGARDIHPEPFTYLSELQEITVRTLDNIVGSRSDLLSDNNTASVVIVDPTEYHESKSMPVSNMRELAPPDEGILYDENGVRMIYDNQDKKSAWYFRNIDDDSLQGVKDSNLRLMQDGSINNWLISSGTQNKAILEVGGKKKFQNVEQTVFFKYLRNTKKKKADRSDIAIILANRANYSTSYNAGIYHTDGRTFFTKNVHPVLTTPTRATQPGVTAHAVQNNWVGFKHCSYDIIEEGGVTYVALEAYVCQNCTAADGSLTLNNQNWKLTSKWVDRGYWGLEDAKSEKTFRSIKNRRLLKSTEILKEPGQFCSIQIDEGVEMVISNWSVREIKVDQTD